MTLGRVGSAGAGLPAEALTEVSPRKSNVSAGVGSADGRSERFVAAQPKAEIGVARGAVSLPSFTCASGGNLRVEEIQGLSLSLGEEDRLVVAAVSLSRAGSSAHKRTRAGRWLKRTGRRRRRWNPGSYFYNFGKHMYSNQSTDVCLYFPRRPPFPLAQRPEVAARCRIPASACPLVEECGGTGARTGAVLPTWEKRSEDVLTAGLAVREWQSL